MKKHENGNESENVTQFTISFYAILQYKPIQRVDELVIETMDNYSCHDEKEKCLARLSRKGDVKIKSNDPE